MKPLKKVFYRLGILKINEQQLDEWFVKKDAAGIQIALEDQRYNIRKIALNKLYKASFKHRLLGRPLTKIVRKDFFPNAELALSLVDQAFYSSFLREKIQKAKATFQDKLRRVQNKSLSRKIHGIKTGNRRFPDKAKMERLGVVKKQLKKPMGRMA